MFKKDHLPGIHRKSYQLTLAFHVKIYDITFGYFIIHLPGVITKEQVIRVFDPSLTLILRTFINKQQFQLA